MQWLFPIVTASFWASIRLITGYEPGRGQVGAPIWRKADWNAQWSKLDPVSDALYRALPADEWATSDQLFDAVPRSIIRWRWEVRPSLALLVSRGLAERHQAGELVRYRKVVPDRA